MSGGCARMPVIGMAAICAKQIALSTGKKSPLDNYFPCAYRVGMKLAEWLEQSGTTITEFALAVGVDTSTAHNWMTRRRTPRLETAIEIQRVTKGKVRPIDFAAEIAGS